MCGCDLHIARIGQISIEALRLKDEIAFSINDSASGSDVNAATSPDVGTCNLCVNEISDSGNRRFAYAFNNCCHCGPRFSIITGSPYDRERTTMASFTMCRACRAEYEQPQNRRFHAQAIACAECGPRLKMLDRDGRALQVCDPITEALERVKRGEIGALKGLGGFHLFCDATNEIVVSELRRRKLREQKPFAVMMHDLAQVAQICKVSRAEAELLASYQRPVVLMRRLIGTWIAEAVAPRNMNLGVMLPYTPLHHLLLQKAGDMPLVMTSGNRSDEPMAFNDDELLSKLSGIADFFVTHNRKIQTRCDDSVVRLVGEYPILMRRARGYVPNPITLPVRCSNPVLAVGGQLKASFGLGRGNEAILSHHLGDLDNYQALREYEWTVEHYEKLFNFTPELLVHDLHPDYASTQYAVERSERSGIRCLRVQHHHAHMASCMAENNVNEPLIGVCLDGSGYGSDGAIGGGEFLIGDYHTFQRAAHLRYVQMPGGEKAIREPWRMAAAFLLDADLRPENSLPEIPQRTQQTIERMLAQKINSPLTSSAGRMFDAVAALLGLCHHTTYEGQAGMELEALATDIPDSGCYDFACAGEDPMVLDTRPVIHGIVEDIRQAVPKSQIARKFHSTFIELIRVVCSQLSRQSGIKTVALSGGVFMNAILLQETIDGLRRDGFRVLFHIQVPANDGGLCLGQLAIAAH
jgi:hydrogenase maturation protein HypF